MFILVGTINAIACQQLDKLEHECPIITKPTEEVSVVYILLIFSFLSICKSCSLNAKHQHEQNCQV